MAQLRVVARQVVDLKSGEELGEHRDGEICIRGPQVMKGYRNDPTATANCIDQHGWLHTGKQYLTKSNTSVRAICAHKAM